METEIIELEPISLIDVHYEKLAPVIAENTIEPTPKDLEIIEEMASIGCSPKEICGVLKIPVEIMKHLPEAKAACGRGAERAKMSLRRLQWKTAQKNPIMQIFLGKQILGQADKVEHRNDDSDINKAKDGFANKLKNIIDVTPKRKTPDTTNGDGVSRSRKVSVDTVGKRGAITAIGELADVVVHGRQRKRKDKVGSGMGKESS